MITGSLHYSTENRDRRVAKLSCKHIVSASKLKKKTLHGQKKDRVTLLKYKKRHNFEKKKPCQRLIIVTPQDVEFMTFQVSNRDPHSLP